MGAKTKIDWCEATWNPITGCLHGCEYCYARKIAQRFDGGWRRDYLPYPVLNEPDKSGGRTQPYPYGFSPTFHRYKLDELSKWKKPRNIFVCSMADMFGEWVPDEWIEEIFEVCKKNPQHSYLFLTKNPQRYFDLEESEKLPQAENMWFGASVTNRQQLKNAEEWIGQLDGHTNTFLSVEPLLEDLSECKEWEKMMCYRYVKWVIVGMETGRRKGKVIPKWQWVDDMMGFCYEAVISVFMKSSLEEIWGEPLIQEFPAELKKGYGC